MNTKDKQEIIKRLKIDTAVCFICGQSDHIDNLEYSQGNRSSKILWFHKKCLKDW